MRIPYLPAAKLLSRAPYFRGRDRLTTLLLHRGARRGTHPAEVSGFRFELNLSEEASQYLFLRDSLPGYVPWLLDRVVEGGMTVVDVGANIGYTALVAARRAGPSGRVLALEPSPRAFASLAQNVSANDVGSIEIDRVACSDRAGTVDLYVAAPSDDYTSLAPPIRGLESTVVAAPAVRLEDYVAERGIAEVDLVKVDVEGAEWMVLKGASKMLAGPLPPLLIVEAGMLNTPRFGYQPPEMVHWLGEFGYDFCILGAEGLVPYREEAVLAPDRIVDLVCFPPAWRARIAALRGGPL